ncbi:MAG TPA: hypothetical protein VH331_10230 [Allosphingosinicella sp.]|jgi:hypothetical protein|nr:hypothetical protein [Allosphingosinicella sp.]
MSLKFGFAAAVLLSASPLLAQPPAAPAAPQPTDAQKAEIQRTGTAFGQCIEAGMHNVSTSVTPEAGAAGVLGGCATQRDALVKAVNAVIETLPQDQRAAAHSQFDGQIGQVQGQLADAIRQQRAAPATPAPATPSH